MNFIQIGRPYKWITEQKWSLSLRTEDKGWVHKNLKQNDIFLLLEWDSELKYVGGWEVNEYSFKILFENQVWYLDIIVDLGEDYSLADMFEIIC